MNKFLITLVALSVTNAAMGQTNQPATNAPRVKAVAPAVPPHVVQIANIEARIKAIEERIKFLSEHQKKMAEKRHLQMVAKQSVVETDRQLGNIYKMIDGLQADAASLKLQVMSLRQRHSL